MRLWAVKHARAFEVIYNTLEKLLVKLHPLMAKIGYSRLEKPIAAIEKLCKGVLFDCRMCGQCALSSTGMSCSMNCPKNLRNGPCGGVRENGHCEVEPNMRCVWIEAWQGSQKMRAANHIFTVQLPVNKSLQGRSAWLARVKEIVQYQEPKVK